MEGLVKHFCGIGFIVLRMFVLLFWWVFLLFFVFAARDFCHRRGT